MGSFDLYTQAFESAVRDADGLYGEYLISSFVATEAKGSFNLKATVQKYWNKLMELIDRFRRFITEKFKAARAGGKKIIDMIKNRGDNSKVDDNDDIPSQIIDEITNMEGFADRTDEICKNVEKMGDKIEEFAEKHMGDQEAFESALDELFDMADDILKNNQDTFDKFFSSAGMDSNMDIAMEGVGSMFRLLRRLSNTILHVDGLMRAIEHLTNTFHRAAGACKRRFSGDNANDAKAASKIQGIINRILGFLSRVGKGLASIPSRILGLIRKIRGNRTRVEKYDGPDPTIG